MESFLCSRGIVVTGAGFGRLGSIPGSRAETVFFVCLFVCTMPSPVGFWPMSMVLRG